MGNHILISVIIPCYNVKEEWILRALNSVRNQTYSYVETLVVDDGSTPEHHEILSRCINQENERLITIANSGVSTARNIGVQNSKGDFVCFLDADDWVSNDYLERAIFFQKQTDADLVIGGTRLCNNTNENSYACRVNDVHKLFVRREFDELIPHLVGENFLMRFSDGYIGRGPTSRLIKKDIAQKVLFDKHLALGEDIAWNMKLLQEVDKVCVVSECWYFYWVNIDSKTNKYDAHLCGDTKDAIDRLTELLNLENDSTYQSLISYTFRLVRNCWGNCLAQLKTRDYKEYTVQRNLLYGSSSWRLLSSFRTLVICSGKMKIVSVFCRLRLFFLFLEIKRQIGRRLNE